MAAALAAGLPAGAAAADATAHDPQYGNKQLWPMLTGKEYSLKEQWPKGRLYVWAHPGTGGGTRVRNGRDVTDPKNWLLDGRPAEELVLDEDTDLLFPASQTRYSVGFRGTEIHEVCRHITIECGAGFVGGGDGRGRQIHGNVWIRKGGNCDCQGATNFLGSRHTFFRNDNVQCSPDQAGQKDADVPNNRGGRLMVSQYFTFNKDPGKSVEFLGHVTVLDEFRIFGCTVIVGRDSILQPGRAATPTIAQGGVLALLDGAYFGSWCNNWGIPDMTVNGGTIQGGLPDRPLARGCTFGLGFKNHTAASYEDPRTRDDPRAAEKWRGRLARVPSLLVYPQSALRSYSADLAKARLVFSVMPGGVGDRTALYIRPMPGSSEEKRDLERSPEAAGFHKWFDALPRGVDCYLSRDVAVDGVAFDHFHEGGVMYQDAATKAKWRNVLFKPNCMGKESDMFRHVEKVEKGGRY